VIGTYYGLRLIDVSINETTPRASVVQAGGALFDVGEGGLEAEVRARPDEIGSMCLAGSLAEEWHLGDAVDGGFDEDFRIWRRGVGWTEGGPAPAGREAQLQALIARSRNDVCTHGGAILATMQALLDAPDLALTGAEVAALLA
jgi:hypothetical protein